MKSALGLQTRTDDRLEDLHFRGVWGMELLIGYGTVDAKSSSAISFFSRWSARMGLRLNGGVTGETPSYQFLAPSSSMLYF